MMNANTSVASSDIGARIKRGIVKALEYAALSGGEKVWDMYCGIGTISLFLAEKAGNVYGVEIVPTVMTTIPKVYNEFRRCQIRYQHIAYMIIRF